MKIIARAALVAVTSLAALASVCTAIAQKPVKTKPPVVKPVGYAKTEAIIKARCVGCHNGPAGQAGVDLSSYAAIQASIVLMSVEESEPPGGILLMPEP